MPAEKETLDALIAVTRELAALGTRVDVGFRELAALGTRVDVGFRDVHGDIALLRELTTEGFQRNRKTTF